MILFIFSSSVLSQVFAVVLLKFFVITPASIYRSISSLYFKTSISIVFCASSDESSFISILSHSITSHCRNVKISW